jgi:hypothetical protein
MLISDHEWIVLQQIGLVLGVIVVLIGFWCGWFKKP